jgi:hypothetical protein
MNEFEGVLEPTIMDFVDRHVRTLLTWDILVFFHRNPEAVLDAEGLANRLGRRIPEVQPEIDSLCASGILSCAGGLIRYRPRADICGVVDLFVDACQDRGRRLALIALVLRNVNPFLN